jgi:hypothetical protein
MAEIQGQPGDSGAISAQDQEPDLHATAAGASPTVSATFGPAPVKPAALAPAPDSPPPVLPDTARVTPPTAERPSPAEPPGPRE